MSAVITSDLPNIRSLFTKGDANPKTAKGEPLGFRTIVLHFAPADLAGFEVCAFRSPACTAGCLNGAGRGGVGGPDNAIQRARRNRARLFRANRAAFMRRAEREIRRHVADCHGAGIRPAVRLNGTSDLPWERIKNPATGLTLPQTFPDVQFYDYTKAPIAFRRELPANYHLTFSLSEENDVHAADALEHGRNVAVVFNLRPGKGGKRPVKGAPLPATFMGRPVIDGDEHDLRFLDPQGGVIVGLRAKSLTNAGRAAMAASGFARAA